MKKRQPTAATQGEIKPHPRRPNRTLLVFSAVGLSAWIVFLLLVALRVIG